MAIQEATKFLINRMEVDYADLVYRAPKPDRSRGMGFEIQIETKRIKGMDRHLGNVEHVELYHGDKMIASAWAIVRQDHMHYWTFTEVVSYSPFWSGVEQWAEATTK